MSVEQESASETEPEQPRIDSDSTEGYVPDYSFNGESFLSSDQYLVGPEYAMEGEELNEDVVVIFPEGIFSQDDIEGLELVNTVLESDASFALERDDYHSWVGLVRNQTDISLIERGNALDDVEGAWLEYEGPAKRYLRVDY